MPRVPLTLTTAMQVDVRIVETEEVIDVGFDAVGNDRLRASGRIAF